MNLLSRSLICLLMFLSISSIGFSQTKLKLDEIEKKITALEEDKGGGNEELIAIWKKAAENKNKLAASIEKTEKNASLLAATEKKATQLDSLKFGEEIVEPTKNLKLEEVSAKVEQLNAEKDSAVLNTSTLKQQEVDRTSRSGLIPGLIRDSKTKLGAIQPLEEIDSADDPLDKAKFQRDLANRDFLQQYLKELELEQKIIEVGAPVLQVETRIAEQKSVYYSEMLEIWKKRLSALKAKETASDKERITQQIKDLKGIPELEKIAIENLELLKDLQEVRATSELDRSQKRLDEINDELAFLKTSQEYARNRIKQLEEAGLSVDQETGQLLRQQADFLTKDKEPGKEIESVSGDYTRTELSLLKLKKMRKALPPNTEEFLNDLNKKMKLKNISLDDARKLISEQDNLLKELIKIKAAIASNQKDQLVSLKKRVLVTESYGQLIKERLIWIKNANVLNTGDLSLEMNGVRKIFADGHFNNWLEKLRLDFLEHTILWSLAILLCGFLIWNFRHYKNLVCAFHKRARRRNCQSFKPTLKGVLLEMVTVLPMPFIFGFLSWRSAGMPMFEKSFFVAAVFSFLAGLAWSYSRSDGLIVSNFKLNERQCKIIHRTMGWFLPLMLPLLMVFIALTQLPIPDPVPDEPEPYGRILYVITMALTMLAFVQLFRPKHQLLNNSNAECTIAKIIFAICMLVPTILITGACLGYYASAILLRNQFIASVWTIVISMFIAALLSRWFLVSSRKLAIKQALKRREALIQERENEETDDPESKVVTKSAEEVEAEAVNVTGVKEQTARLVKVTLICSIVFSLWGIWSESLPALSVLDKQKLWEHSANSKSESKAPSNPITSIVSGSSKSESSVKESVEVEQTEDKENWVSLQDLLFSIIIFILTYIAASNIPGLLEITVLDNLNIKSGAAFALTTTVRYLIVLFGIIWAFGNIGVTWSSIQWIAAAVTLGIGFGLQEVFANFVAGLILLYERPIRLGDVVTVGEVSGRVTQIKIRATTVVKFNNHELIVPNKEFITGQLTNWTLNDNIIRTEVNVGIAYGSDTKLAEKVLMKVAESHKKVLKTPKPDVLFLAFGASSLDFQLRCFVAGYDDFRPTQSDLHYQVNKAFADEGIEISFPQQDLHIKTVEEAIPLKIAKEVVSSE